jgi:HK97 family phage major capsid protein
MLRRKKQIEEVIFMEKREILGVSLTDYDLTDPMEKLQAKKNQLVTAAKRLLKNAEAEKRGLTQQEEEDYNELDRRIDMINLELEERKLNNMKEHRGVTKPMPNTNSVNTKIHATEAYRNAFWNAIRQGNGAVLDTEEVRMLREARALSVGTLTAGGYTVPESMENQLVEKLEEQNVMRQLGRVIRVQGGDRKIPVVADSGTATWLTEGQAYVESDVVYDSVTLSGYKMGRVIQISEELLQDSIIDMEEHVISEFAKSFGKLEEEAFINGDGVNKPTGILNDATLGKTGAAGQTTSVTAEDLIDLFHALPRPYRSNAVWLMHDSTAKAIRKLKDNDGQYLWQPGLQAGVPDLLLGRPVYYSPYMPQMAASAKSILFFDPSYYWIADRAGRTMDRLNELYRANGRIGIIGNQRVDGKLILPEAAVYYQNAAS